MSDESTQGKPKRASKAKTPATPTEYVVLESLPANEGDKGVKYMNGDDVEGSEVWLGVGVITASGNEKTLIEKWAAEQKRVGSFKLVPARSWKGGVRVFEKTSLTSEAIA